MSLELVNPNTQKAIPESLALQPEIMLGGVIARANSYISAQPEGPYKPGQIITINMPFEMLDFRSSTLQFNIKGTVGNAVNPAFAKDIRSIFRRIVVKFGSKAIYDVDSHGLLFNILDGTLDRQWESTVGNITTGTGTTVERQNSFTTDKRFTVQLYNNEESFFYNVFPLQKLGVQMVIEFHLDSVFNVVEQTGVDYTNCSYEVSRVQWHTASIIPSESWNNLYNSRVCECMTYTYFTYENLYDSSLLKTGIRKVSKVLPFKFSSIIGVIGVMQPTTNSLLNQNKLSTFAYNGLSQLQIKVGVSTFPLDTSRSLQDLLLMYAETMGLSMRFPFKQAVNYDCLVNTVDSPYNFVFGISLCKHIKENRDINVSLDGLNLIQGNNMVLDMEFDSALGADYILNLYAIVENTISYQKNGSIIYNN